MYPTWINFMPGVAAFLVVMIVTAGGRAIHNMIDHYHAKHRHC